VIRPQSPSIWDKPHKLLAAGAACCRVFAGSATGSNGGMTDDELVDTEAAAAAAEAAKIGGDPGAAPTTDDGSPADEAHRPLAEAGQGESEGFEQAEAELIDHASHGDQHAARRVLDDAGNTEDPGAAR
jgi:hypothetical protein